MKLEEELGAKLFDRLGRRVTLTQFGEAFLPRALAILREVGEARCQIQEMAGIEAGRVRLGAIATVAPYLLPNVLSGFCRRYPDIQLRMIEDITTALLAKLREGSLDLALVAHPVVGHDLVYEEILTEPLYVVVPDAHRIARRQSISLKEVENEPFLLLKEGHCFRETTISACRRAHVRPNVVFESGQFATVLGLVSAGVGVSVIPEMAIERRTRCKFVRVNDQHALRRLGFIYLKHHFQTKAQRAVIDHFKVYAVKQNGN